jgi:hypothetical protein
MDNAKVNQKTMKILNFKCGSERNEQFLCYRGENIKPFYLLNDTVHILKTIRNSWITEKTKTLEYKLPGEDAVRFAEWKFIVSLLETDCGIVKMSPLTNKSVFPTPIERQNVGLVLKVFSDKTVAALRTKFKQKAEDTAIFIEIIVKWWTIVNSKVKGLDQRLNDIRRTAITSKDDCKLEFLETFIPQFAQFLQPNNIQNRVKKMTLDTTHALINTSCGLAHCAKYLLDSGLSYVLLGHIQSDPLEKQFGKYRQGSGGTYLITVQSITQKFNIDRARKLLRLATSDEDFLILPSADHSCNKCDLSVIEFDLAQCIAAEDFLNTESKQGLTYIAGYICLKMQKLHEYLQCNDTYEMYLKYGEFTDNFSRGKLKEPSDSLVYFVFYCYYIFIMYANSLCKKAYIEIFFNCNQYYNLIQCNVRKIATILTNIFLNNLCKRIADKNDDRSELLIKKAKLKCSE